MSLRYKITSGSTEDYVIKDISGYYSFFSDRGKWLLDKQEHFLLSDEDLGVFIRNVQIALEKLLKIKIKKHPYLPPNEVIGEVFGKKRTFDLRNDVEDQIFWLSSLYNLLQKDDRFYFEYIPLH